MECFKLYETLLLTQQIYQVYVVQKDFSTMKPCGHCGETLL